MPLEIATSWRPRSNCSFAIALAHPARGRIRRWRERVRAPSAGVEHRPARPSCPADSDRALQLFATATRGAMPPPTLQTLDEPGGGPRGRELLGELVEHLALRLRHGSAPDDAMPRLTRPAEERDSSCEQRQVPAAPDEARHPDEPARFLLLPPDLSHRRECIHRGPLPSSGVSLLGARPEDR